MSSALGRHVDSRRTQATPQSEPAREDQVKNNAGGFVFEVGSTGQRRPCLHVETSTGPLAQGMSVKRESLEGCDEVGTDTRLHRFLTIGTEGGTYYVGERDLTRDNASVIVALAQASDPRLVTEAVRVSAAGRAPSNDPAIFALAAAGGLGSEAYRAEAYRQLPQVVRTGHHMLTFAAYSELFRGWGPQLCKAVGRWYSGWDWREEREDGLPAIEGLAYQLLKYKQRDHWSQRDLLRLSHFGRVPLTPERRALFTYVLKGEAGDGLAQLAQAAIEAHATSDPRQWVSLITVNRSLSWEMLPSEALKEPRVWRALIEGGSLPPHALVRQLPRLTQLGVLQQGDQFTALVCQRLSDPGRLARARVHPIAVLLALKTYAGGHSLRGNGTWKPVPVVTDALDAAFYAAFGAVSPSGKRVMECLDVSSSMGSQAGGLPLSCREVIAAMAMVSVKTEPLTSTWGFTRILSPLDISSRRRLDDVVRAISGLAFGGTDCALPMVHALRNKLPVDVFRVSTDNETWAGGVHPHEALENYRQGMGIDARLQVVGITSTGLSIADPLDPRQLDVAGFDSAVPGLLADHARGDL
jgi:60 kDa SS-A/Ro ribonucleoprotein